jgi:hypothetical protein
MLNLNLSGSCPQKAWCPPAVLLKLPGAESSGEQRGADAAGDGRGREVSRNR